MRQDHIGRWQTTISFSPAFDGDQNSLVEGTITWDISKGTYTYFSSSASNGRTCKNVRVLSAGNGHVFEKSKRFLALAEFPAGRQGADDLSQWNGVLYNSNKHFLHGESSQLNFPPSETVMIWWINRAMAVLPDGWTIGKEYSAQNKTLEEKYVLKTITQYKENNYRSASYEIIGDVMLTPWSVDLGPVGLIPVKAEDNDLLGVWRDENQDTFTVVPPSKSLFPEYPFVGRRPNDNEHKTMISSTFLSPAEDNIHVKTYGWDCVMNHSDFPGAIHWFVTADKKLVRVVYPAGCYFFSGQPYVDIFQRQP